MARARRPSSKLSSLGSACPSWSRAAVERWTVADRYAGVEHAERDAAERLVSDVARLREDEELFRYVLSRRGRRVAAVAANVADRHDAGLKKALERVRRTVMFVSGQPVG
jgi:hypothetical protein